MFVNAATPTPVIAASEPPPIATSQRPQATRRAAAPIAWVAGCARGDDRLARAVVPRPHRDGRRSGVRHHHRDEERRHAPRALLVEDVDLLLEGLEPPDPGSEDDPGPASGRRRDLTGVLERHLCGGHRELAEAVYPPHLFRPELDSGVEVVRPCACRQARATSRPVQKSPRPMPHPASDSHAGDRDPPCRVPDRRGRPREASELRGH